MTEAFATVVVDERPSSASASPRILVTNDDGIESPGLRLLAAALDDVHDDVIVAAPAIDSSGSGTAIGRFEADLGVELHRADFDGVTAYTVAGPPGLAVTAAALGAFGATPDLVVSGINAGINTGHSVIHSGTVGAVLTARTFGSRGLAMSLADSDQWHWDTAVDVALSASEWLLAQRRQRSVLNVNVPARCLAEVAGVRWADLDEFGHFRVATADVEHQRLQFEIAGSGAGLDPASDTALCREGFVTLTMLSGIEPQPYPDVEAQVVWRP
jgi:5'-nucleotidase